MSIHYPSEATSSHTHSDIHIIDGGGGKETSLQDIHREVQGGSIKEEKRPSYMVGPNKDLDLT